MSLKVLAAAVARRGLRETAHAPSEETHRHADETPREASAPREAVPERPEQERPQDNAEVVLPLGESVRIYVPSLGCELWIASDPEEAKILRAELAVEDDERAVIAADDVLKLRGQPCELVDATVRALAILGGAILSGGSDTPEPHSANDSPDPQRGEA